LYVFIADLPDQINPQQEKKDNKQAYLPNGNAEKRGHYQQQYSAESGGETVDEDIDKGFDLVF
jgi:hypothetical protein